MWILTKNPIIQNIPQIDENIEISVFPNPFKDEITVYIDNSFSAKIEILNAIGQQIMEIQPNAKMNFISTNNFSKGIYFIKVKTKESTRVFKLLKE
jgi:hypothetical protein